MEVSIQNQNGLDAVLNVKVLPQDYLGEINKSIAEYQKTIQLPGFRKGKVPSGMVRKMVEKDMKREKIEGLVQKSIQSYLEENNIHLVLSPLSAYEREDINWKEDSFEFNYDIGIKPALNINFEELNSLVRYKVEVSDEEVEAEVAKIRSQAGRPDLLDTMEEGEEVSAAFHFHELGEEGTPLDGGQKKIKMYKATELPAGLRTHFAGKPKGAKEVINLSSLLSEEEIMQLFGIDKMTAKDLSQDFEVELTAIFREHLADLDQDLFDRVFGPDTVGNEEEFRNRIREFSEEEFKFRSTSLLFTDVKDALMDNVEVEMPLEFIKKYFLVSSSAKSVEEVENFDEQYKKFQEELKWIIIAEDIARKQGIEVTEEQVVNYAMGLIQNEMMNRGMGNADEPTLKKYAIDYLQQEHNYSRTWIMLRDNAVFRYVDSVITPKEKVISREELEDLLKQ